MMSDACGEPLLKLEILSQPQVLSGVRAMMAETAERTGFDKATASRIALAVDEALSNVIVHGYERRPDGVIWLRVCLHRAGGLTFVIEDCAAQVEPESIRSRDIDDIRPGGLGVHIIREVMDYVRYEKRQKEGMRLTMTKMIAVGRGKPTESATRGVTEGGAS